MDLHEQWSQQQLVEVQVGQGLYSDLTQQLTQKGVRECKTMHTRFICLFGAVHKLQQLGW
jgi:hypothetical protein